MTCLGLNRKMLIPFWLTSGQRHSLIPRLMLGLMILSLGWPAAAGAQDLSLKQAVMQALVQNPGIQAADAQLKKAGYTVSTARSGLLPQVGLTGRYSRTNNPMWAFGTKLNQQSITAMDFNPDRLNDPDSISNWSSGVSVNWSLYDSGQTWHGLKQAGMGQEVQQLSATRIRQQVTAGTITAYLGALLARENQKVIEKSVETARAHLKLVQSRYDSGFVAKSDLLRAQVHIADLEQQLSDAVCLADISKAQLRVLMGADQGEVYTLVTPLEEGEGALDKPGADPFNDPQADLATWQADALAGRPDLKQLALQQKILQEDMAKAKSARYPSVSLNGNYEVDTEDFDNTASNYTLGAMVSVPLYTGGRNSSRIKEATEALSRVRAQIRGMKHQISIEVRQAFFNARSARDRIAVARASVGQAEEALRIVKNRYESGLFTITDLLAAQVMVQQSRTNELKAIHDFRAAETGLTLAAGKTQEL